MFGLLFARTKTIAVIVCSFSPAARCKMGPRSLDRTTHSSEHTLTHTHTSHDWRRHRDENCPLDLGSGRPSSNKSNKMIITIITTISSICVPYFALCWRVPPSNVCVLLMRARKPICARKSCRRDARANLARHFARHFSVVFNSVRQLTGANRHSSRLCARARPIADTKPIVGESRRRTRARASAAWRCCW